VDGRLLFGSGNRGCENVWTRRLLPSGKIPGFSALAEVADAIQTMIIRGAPAIGIAAVMGWL
jgi:methylthioribose-1-phosphate isomerase